MHSFSRFRQDVQKVEGFYETIVPLMDDRLYRRYFRVFQPTMLSIADFLKDADIFQQSDFKVPYLKVISMTLCYLGTSATTQQ